ncbi:MAG: isoprenyl transferase [Sneathiella sp.]|nr:isoprenyl transferase [Sneathiella sp.]
MEVVGKKDLLPSRPEHVAIIMDGNGRWANRRSMSRMQGHEQGANAVREAIKGCREFGIPYLTLFAFSSENWARPTEEVNHLMGLFRFFFKKELKSLLEADVKVTFIGDINRLPKDVQKLAEELVQKTADKDKLHLTIALSYGGRAEIAEAAKRLAEKVKSGDVNAEDISEENFGDFLQTSDIPDPDMIIRTSGEKRISNFLLWQAAYAEFFFLDILWPDFTKQDLQIAVEEFATRNRRYGAISA